MVSGILPVVGVPTTT
ncbi:hypothetical protein, partial [Vibrio cholerae]